MKTVTFFLVAFATFESIAGQPFITVGADNDIACDFHNIQAAIDSNDSTVIRIASNKNYFENLELSAKTRQLIGGYANCTTAGNNITDLSQALITANGSDTAVRVSNSSGNFHTVIIRNIVIANGTTGFFVSSQNPGSVVSVTLDNARVFNNTNRGVGMQTLNASNAELIVNDSVIDFNMGGGFECFGAGASLKLTGETVVSDNVASAEGGGVSAASGCSLAVYSPTIISDNETDLSGGGISLKNAEAEIYGFATGCANGICFGEWDSPVKIVQNAAGVNGGNQFGGGISIVGASSSVVMFNTVVESNTAQLGGGINVSGGEVTVVGYESPTDPCWSVGQCSQIIKNKANSGGAVFASNEAVVNISHTHINQNRADTGVVGHSSGQALISISSSVISNNGNNGLGDYNDQHLFNNSSSQLVLDYVTVADNPTSLSMIDNGNGEVEVKSSVLFDEQDIYSESGVSPLSSFECVMASEDSSFSAGGTVSVVNQDIEPVFVNPAAGNYHLLVNSPAIDYCYDASGNASSDIDYDERGIDNPDVSNLHGIYDIGADEFNINNDIIFMNGFEPN